MRRRRRRRGCMSQLLKNIVIGMALILAIIGTMSLLDSTNTTDKPLETSTISNAPVIETPLISINPDNTESTNVDEDNYKQEQLVENDPTSTQEIESEPTEKPVLEGEKIADEIETEAEPIKYGILKLRAINPENKEKLNANYVVYDKDDVKVAEISNVDKTSFRLATGKYKVVTSLTQPDENTAHPSPVVQKSQYISVREYIISEQVFELEPPASVGILQVSAVSATDHNQAMRTKFIIKTENGETIAARNNVTSSLFKLKAGSYKVLLSSGNNSDFRTVVVEAGESTEEVFKLQESFNQGRLLVRILDIRSSTPLRADITITGSDGSNIQELKSVLKTELALSEGNYKIRVTGPNGQSTKSITVVAGQATNEIFRFDKPQEAPPRQDTKITDNVTIKSVNDKETKKIEEVKDIVKNDIGDQVTQILEELKGKVTDDIGDQNAQKIEEVKDIVKSDIDDQDTQKLEELKGKVTDDIGDQNAQKLEEVKDIVKSDIDDQDTQKLKEVKGIVKDDIADQDAQILEELNNILKNDIGDRDTKRIEEVKDIVKNNNSPNAIVRIIARNNLDNQLLKSNIYIQSSTGKHLDKKIYVDNAEFNLAPSVYKITVRSKNREDMVKTIRVSANKDINETFLLKEQLKALAIKKPKKIEELKDIVKNNNSPNAIVRIFARNKLDNQLLKSNIYIQSSTGKHLDKKIYVDNAEFNLAPGVYKITVRSKNREDMVKTIRVSANKDIYETFLLKELLRALAIKKPKN